MGMQKRNFHPGVKSKLGIPKIFPFVFSSLACVSFIKPLTKAAKMLCKSALLPLPPLGAKGATDPTKRTDALAEQSPEDTVSWRQLGGRDGYSVPPMVTYNLGYWDSWRRGDRSGLFVCRHSSWQSLAQGDTTFGDPLPHFPGQTQGSGTSHQGFSLDFILSWKNLAAGRLDGSVG